MTQDWITDFDAAWCTRQIARYDGISLPNALTAQTRELLLAELEQSVLEEQPREYGKYATKQSFSAVSSFAPESKFLKVKELLQNHLAKKFGAVRPCPLVKELKFTDLVVQRYPAGPVGISPHRDGKGYINLIAVFVLEGEGRFCFCDDREGTDPRAIVHEPGDLILMRGAGFLGSDIQPFHFVDKITKRRTTFALRQR